jgi:Membrane domain of glycerophosphoryl diester phosphodiesterase
MSSAALRPLSIGEILDVAFGLYRRHFATLAVIVMICSGVPLLLNLYIQASGGYFANGFLSLGYLVLAVVLSSVGTAATVFVVSESYLGRTLGPRAALERARPFVGRLIVYSISFSLVVGLGFLLLIVPGVILLCGLILTTPVLVLEGSSDAMAAMARSWNLTKGARGRMFAICLVVAVLVYVPMAALGVAAAIVLPGTAASGASIGAMALGVLALTSLVQMVVMPFFYCAITVAYYDLRVRKEAFDLEVLATTLQAA